jgi:deleted-in-malignant-brain-tumors protein 1
VGFDNCTNDTMRLTGGSTNSEGRVEICYNGVWGSICDSNWNGIEAKVVCKSLGHQFYGAIPYKNSHFGLSNLPINIYNFVCADGQTDIAHCQVSRVPYYYTNCNPYHEVGIKCQPKCIEGEIQLDYGIAHRYSSVLVCLNGTWSKICGRGKSLIDGNLASVICRQAGYSPYGAMSAVGLWNSLTYPIGMHDITCSGTESSITDCQYSNIPNRICYSNDAVGVFCQETTIEGPINCTDGDVRLLTGGYSSNEGILHMCVNKAWGSLCWRDYWNNVNTRLACTQLGYTTYGNSYQLGVTDKRFPVLIAGINCQYADTSLSSCDRAPLTDLKSCSIHVVKLYCQEPCVTGSVRLRGGLYHGQVQVCIGGVWGSICRNDYWDNNDASVICRQLGFSPYGAIALTGDSRDYDSNDPTFYEGLNCRGNEGHIFDCPVDQLASVCQYKWDDANIVCPVHGSEYSNCMMVRSG